MILHWVSNGFKKRWTGKCEMGRWNRWKERWQNITRKKSTKIRRCMKDGRKKIQNRGLSNSITYAWEHNDADLHCYSFSIQSEGMESCSSTNLELGAFDYIPYLYMQTYLQCRNEIYVFFLVCGMRCTYISLPPKLLWGRAFFRYVFKWLGWGKRSLFKSNSWRENAQCLQGENGVTEGEERWWNHHCRFVPVPTEIINKTFLDFKELA